jgi:hypothetical protein
MMYQPSQQPARKRRPERLRARPVLHASTPLACDQVAGKRAQVGMDLRAPWEPVWQGMAGQYRSLAGEHQVRFAARGLCGQQMLQVVTAGGHAVQVKSVALADLLEQPRKRLAAGATVVGGMGAEEDGIDPRAHRRQHLVHAGMDGVERGHVDQAAPQAGLVGGDRDMKARVIQSRNGIECAGQRGPVLRRRDERVAVMVDRAVALKDDQFHGALQHSLRPAAGPPQGRPAPSGGSDDMPCGAVHGFRRGATGRPRGSSRRAGT